MSGLEAFVEKFTTVPGTDTSIGAELLNFYLMLLTGVAASVLGKKSGLVQHLKSDPVMLQLLIFLVIISKAISFSKYEDDAIKTLFTAACVYVWFMMSVRLSGQEVMTMLSMLLVGQIVYRVKMSPGLVTEESTRDMLNKIETMAYGAAMVYVLFRFFVLVQKSSDPFTDVYTTFVPSKKTKFYE